MRTRPYARPRTIARLLSCAFGGAPAALGGTLVATPAVFAQAAPGYEEAPRDGGAWWSVTVGAAGARLTCDLCDPARELGPWADVAFGTYASPAVRVGVEGGAWTHDDDGVRESVYRAGVVAEVAPRAGSGLYLLGGVGWLGYRAESFNCDTIRLSVGVGWDLPLSGRWAVGNTLTLDAASFGSLKNDQTTVARGVGMSVMRLGVHLRRR